MRGSLLLVLGLVVGCGGHHAEHEKKAPAPPSVQVVTPAPRELVRTVGQPGVIESHEQTAVVSRVAGFVKKWHVDVGDRVAKDDVLIELECPELAEDLRQKSAMVDQARAEVRQAKAALEVSIRKEQAAADEIEEAKGGVKRYQADVDRWTGEFARIGKLVAERVVDQQVLSETRKQLAAATASFEMAGSRVRTDQTQRLAGAAAVERSRADVATADAKVKVAEADAHRAATMLGFAAVRAPYDAVVTDRNVSVGDVVRPSSGAADGQDSDGGGGGRSMPLYVLHRADPVVFVVGVPEAHAAHVRKDCPAVVRVPGLGNEERLAKVKRTSWALQARSRTLTAEIELPNSDGRLVPGMYAFGQLRIARSAPFALPIAAVFDVGDQKCCYIVENGKTRRVALQVGLSDGAWIEVRARATGDSAGTAWTPITGAEQVVVGDLSELTDGLAVSPTKSARVP